MKTVTPLLRCFFCTYFLLHMNLRLWKGGNHLSCHLHPDTGHGHFPDITFLDPGIASTSVDYHVKKNNNKLLVKNNLVQLLENKGRGEKNLILLVRDIAFCSSILMYPRLFLSLLTSIFHFI